MSANKYLLQFFPKDLFYRFNDKISFLNEERVVSEYTLPKNADFYVPISPELKMAPESILTEVAIQGGPVVLNKYYLVQNGKDVFSHDVYLLSSKTEFPDYCTAGEKLIVSSRVAHFKEEILTMRCTVEISKTNGQIVLNGEFSTKMIESKRNGE